MAQSSNATVINPKMKPSQRQAIELDLKASEEALSNPDITPYIDRSAMARQVKRFREVLERDAPKPYETSKEKDDAAKEARELQAKFTNNMLSEEEMRRNRNGSANKHLKWEMLHKKDIKKWREIMKRLEHDSDDPDLTSHDKFRRSRPFAYDSNAQISGHHAMSALAKQNFPSDMGPEAKKANTQPQGK